MKIQKVDPVGYANVSAITTAIIVFIGLLLLIIFGSLLGDAIEKAGGLRQLIGNGIVAIIFIPPLCGFVTWIFTWIYISILNWSLEKIGGLQIDTSE